MPRKTEYAIAESLRKLLYTKPLNKITISDIAEDCGINRMTFYYHFKDIYDLVEWMCNEIADKALQGSDSVSAWVGGLSNLLEAIYDNRDFIAAVCHVLDRDEVWAYLYRLINIYIINTSKEFVENYESLDDYLKFTADFYSFAFAGVIVKWIDEGLKVPVEQMVFNISTLMDGTLKNSIESYYRKKKKMMADKY